MYVTRGTFSRDLRDGKTSFGSYLRLNFPNLRPIQANYKARVGALVVDSAGASPALVGTSVDLIPRVIAEPESVPESAMLLFPFLPSYHEGLERLMELAREPDPDLQARATWVMGLCVAAYRAGLAAPSEIRDRILAGDFIPDILMDEVPESAVAELVAMRGLIKSQLLPLLQAPTVYGPLFDLSKPGATQRTAAEADIISGGLLIDVKSNLAAKNSLGARPDVLKPEHVMQLIGYSLMDYSDAYKIDRVAIYSARYGSLIDWSLEEVVRTAAGVAFNFGSAKQEVWDLMQQDPKYV